MDHEQVGRLWDGNAEAWIRLVRAGYDIYRDHLNTPVFFAMLPDVAGLDIDIAEAFIAHARQAEAEEPLGIDYQAASAVDLPFANGAWTVDGWACRSAFRLRFEPERRYDHIGFRVVAVRP